MPSILDSTCFEIYFSVQTSKFSVSYHNHRQYFVLHQRLSFFLPTITLHSAFPRAIPYLYYTPLQGSITLYNTTHAHHLAKIRHTLHTHTHAHSSRHITPSRFNLQKKLIHTHINQNFPFFPTLYFLPPVPAAPSR